MNSRSLLLFCATLGALAPCCAQNASPALKTRLRAQIVNIAPQLTGNGKSPGQDDVLVLPLAQLGDVATANRLATTPLARDGIAQWRTEQRALRGDWSGASQQAASVRNGTIRADSFLVIARLATDRGDFAAAHRALVKAMSALGQAPDAEQLAYAGWLWWRTGDVAGARRVFVSRAWPVAVRQDRRANDQFPENFPDDKQNAVLRFVGRCGLLAEFVQSIERSATGPNSTLARNWLLAFAQTPGDVRFFTQRALATPRISAAELEFLALQLARRGQNAEARQLRAASLSISPPDAAPSDDPATRLSREFTRISLSAQLDDRATFATLAERWPAAIRGARDAENLGLMPQLIRVLSQESSGGSMKLKANAARTDIDDLSARLLKNPGQSSITALAPLIGYYAPRDAQTTRALVEAVTAQLAAQKARMDAERKSSSYSWNWDFEASKLAAQLRDSSHVAAARAVVEALLRYTPPEFRQAQAQEFLRLGFDTPARQMFDPLASLQRQLKARPFLDYGWAGYAEAEARHRGAEAPARWFGALKTPRQRAEVLPGWINGLVPQLQLAAPYVRASVSVGADAGVSISRIDAES